jgi:hypothetical protein
MTSHTLPDVTRAQRIWRRVLIVSGIGGLGLGGLVLVMDVRPTAWLGILIWFAGAIIVHDAVIGPVVFGIAVVMRKLGRRMPVVVLAIVQAAIVIAAIMTAIVLPAAFKKEIGSANPTILPLDYLPNLAGFYFVLAAVTVAIVVGYLLVVSRRAKRRPRVDQD